MLYRETLKLKDLTLRNRIVMPPMATNKAVDGAPGEALIEYYRERAKGTALIVVEHAYVLPEGMAHAGQLSMADDGAIGAYRALTGAIHGEGCLAIAQLNHAGAAARDTGLPALAPSETLRRDGTTAAAMGPEDLARVRDGFVRAALRAKAAGYDGVEIHGAHGYLLSQFYSPLTNRRGDAYGRQSIENRTRLHREILRAVREAVGEDYPVAIRFGACDYAEGGSLPEEAAPAARAFEEAGADLIDVSGGLNGFTVPGRTEPGWFRELSAPIRAAVSIPVLLTGGVTAPQEMERLLAEGAADLIGVGRAMLKDAAWSRRALAD